MLANRAMQLDRDGDGQLDLQEFAYLFSPDGEVTEALERTFQKKFLKRNGKIDFASMRNFLTNVAADQRREYQIFDRYRRCPAGPRRRPLIPSSNESLN